jgi:hypothetical protein
VVNHTDSSGNKHIGFIVLLYYKKIEEVNAAGADLKSKLPVNVYGISVQPDMWFVAYYAANLKGPVLDALKLAVGSGMPNDFEQFRKRTGMAGDD